MRKKILLITISLGIFIFVSNCFTVSAADTILYDEDYSLDAGYYSYYGINVSSAPVYIHIELTCDDDINLYIFNDTEATKWENSETAVGYLFNDVSSLDIYQTLPTVDTWWVYLDNTESVVTSKNGHITITTVDEIPSTTTPTTTTTPSGNTGSFSEEITFTVSNLAYQAFYITTTADNAKVQVEFVCEGNDIDFFIANDANFKAWQNNPIFTGAEGFIWRNKVTLEVEVTLPDAGKWWFVFDNLLSVFNSKTVTFKLTVVSSAAGFELLTVPIIFAAIIIYRRKRIKCFT